MVESNSGTRERCQTGHTIFVDGVLQGWGVPDRYSLSVDIHPVSTLASTRCSYVLPARDRRTVVPRTLDLRVLMCV
jgi:hypothetical protein